MKSIPFRIFLIINYGFVLGFCLYCFPYSLEESQIRRTQGKLEPYENCGVKLGCRPGLRINDQRISCVGAISGGVFVCPKIARVLEGEVFWYPQRTLLMGEVIQVTRIASGESIIFRATIGEIQQQIFFDIFLLIMMFSLIPIGVYSILKGRK